MPSEVFFIAAKSLTPKAAYIELHTNYLMVLRVYRKYLIHNIIKYICQMITLIF